MDKSNATHPKFQDCLDELNLCSVLEAQLHNHCSLKSLVEKIESVPTILAAKFVGEIAMRLHEKEHGKKPTRLSQVRAYSIEELHKQWVQDHIDDPPEGFNNKAQCEHDEELLERIDESLTLCKSWINSKKSKTNSGS